ncbi:hypothetical protein ACFWB2_19880 [Streptomyces virginiae]|uniref:hypothetical protein n=1 Tax=Streptomyces virginiae TaxID=1961 RepID=UPI00364AB260
MDRAVAGDARRSRVGEGRAGRAPGCPGYAGFAPAAVGAEGVHIIPHACGAMVGWMPDEIQRLRAQVGV